MKNIIRAHSTLDMRRSTFLLHKPQQLVFRQYAHNPIKFLSTDALADKKPIATDDIPNEILSEETIKDTYTTRESNPEIKLKKRTAIGRSVIRAMLREAHYLPDPNARSYMYDYLLDRFRRFLPTKEKPLELSNERQAELLRSARKYLSELRRANGGEIKMLNKVLHITYGRIGKRRHLLMNEIMVTRPESGDQVSEETIESSTPFDPPPPQRRPRKQRIEEITEAPILRPQLKALLQSQINANPPPLTRPNPKSLNPDIPKTNSWASPMPLARVKNMTYKFYATMLERALPPLPPAEWEELRQRALGITKFQGLTPRRPRGTGVVPRPDPAEVLDLELKSSGPIYIDVFLAKADAKTKASHVTDRFMQRRWAGVFAQCPKMEWNEELDKWDVTWGVDLLDDDLKAAAGGDSLEPDSFSTGPLAESGGPAKARKNGLKAKKPAHLNPKKSEKSQ